MTVVEDPPPTGSSQDPAAPSHLGVGEALTTAAGTTSNDSYALIFDWRVSSTTRVHHGLISAAERGPDRPRAYYSIRIGPQLFNSGRPRTAGTVLIPQSLVSTHEDDDGENTIRVEDVCLWDRAEFSRSTLHWSGGIRTASGVARPFEPIAGGADPQQRTLIVPRREAGPEVLHDTTISMEDWTLPNAAWHALAQVSWPEEPERGSANAFGPDTLERL